MIFVYLLKEGRCEIGIEKACLSYRSREKGIGFGILAICALLFANFVAFFIHLILEIRRKRKIGKNEEIDFEIPGKIF